MKMDYFDEKYRLIANNGKMRVILFYAAVVTAEKEGLAGNLSG